MTPRHLGFACLVLVACGTTSGSGNADHTPCTAAAQGVTGTALQATQVVLSGSSGPGSCPRRVLASSADVDDAFPAHDAPAEVTSTDFSRDRVVLGSSNPAIEFTVDDGTGITVGEEQLCQGVAPSCVAYIVHGTTKTALSVVTCPYTGPDPCLAP